MALDYFWEKEWENFGRLFEFFESAWQVTAKSILLQIEIELTTATGYLKTFLFFSIKKGAKHFRLTQTICLTWNKIIPFIFGFVKLLIHLPFFKKYKREYKNNAFLGKEIFLQKSVPSLIL